MKLFLAGGSGLGKTTFLKKACDKFKFEYRGSITRNRWNNSNDFFSLPFLDRQKFLISAAVDCHLSTDDFIANDRSVFDYYTWTELLSPGFREDLPKNILSDSAIIIIPTPTLEWYMDNIGNFKNDELRLKAYLERAGRSSMTDFQLANTVHRTTIYLEERIRQMAVQYMTPTTYVVEFHDEDIHENFWGWQDTAEGFLNQIMAPSFYNARAVT